MRSTPEQTEHRTFGQDGGCCHRLSGFQQTIEEILLKLGGAELPQKSGPAMQFRETQFFYGGEV